MLFIIFKLPRTGSTRVAKYLDRAAGVRCFHEILNDCDDPDHDARIRAQLSSVRAGKPRIGFTINPFKHAITSTDFFDPRPYCGADQGRVVSLIRENVFDQAVSMWVSTELKIWPGDSQSRTAAQLRSFIDQGGVEIPARKFQRICKRFARQNEDLVTFSRAFAGEYGMEYLATTYEGVYQQPHADLKKLESCLDITVDRELIESSGKLLPSPRDWVANYDQLVEAYPPGTPLSRIES